MQVKFYPLCLIICIFLSLECAAQELFPKKEIYHVWIVAEEKLNAGLFDDALRLYNTNTGNPSFAMKVRQISRLKEISSEGDKLRKNKKFAEAIEKYKDYRKLRDMVALKFFENKIEQCLVGVNQESLTELTSQQRVITGFEFAHRGREKLSKMDTTGAKRDFKNAKALGGTRNNILKEQFTDGARIANELALWGQKYEELKKSVKSKTQELTLLESYREIRNLDIPEFELKIRELKAELDGNNSLSAISKLCDTDLILTYVNSNKSASQFSVLFQRRLNEFKSTQKKINILRQNKDNTETVKSAYASLISWIQDFPEEIRNNVKRCVEEEYADFLNSLPVKTISECTGKEDFYKGVQLIRADLLNCNTVRAQLLWKKNLLYIRGCSDENLMLNETELLRDSIILMAKNDSLLAGYRGQLQQSLKVGDCSKRIKIYQQMRLLRICNQEVLEEEIANGLAEAKNCRSRSWFRPELIGGISASLPKYKIADRSKKMNNGWSGSAGVQFSYIDHKNPVDFSIGVEYLETHYSVLGTRGSVLEDFTLSGANGILALKLHKPNTTPNRIRPYIKLGTEIFIPATYKYNNYSNFSSDNSTVEIQNTIISLSGALGLEIQKKHFGVFIECLGNSGIGNIYGDSVSHLTTTPNQKVEAKISRVGVRIGFRIW